ncbi:MAG TPA: GNAT family N-acetyltransferase [Gaiellaceae bacterium]|nr:GNAT family N-acetyltransferase [Gaiellaceae bacterium]
MGVLTSACAPFRRAPRGRGRRLGRVGPVSDRCVYGGVVENSVYVAGSVRGRGVGRRLLQELIASTEAAGIWTIQTGIFPENEEIIRLHRRVGLEVVGELSGSAS